MLLTPKLCLLDVLDIQSDFLTQLQKRISQICGSVVDENSNDYKVHNWAQDQVREPKSEHCDKQVILHFIQLLKLRVQIKYEELVVLLCGELLEIVKIQIAEDEEAFLHLFIIFPCLNSESALLIETSVIGFIGPGWDFKNANIDTKVTVQYSTDWFLDPPVFNFGAENFLTQMINRLFVVELQNDWALVDGGSDHVLLLVWLEEKLYHVDIEADGAIVVASDWLTHIDADAAHQCLRTCIGVQVDHHGFFLIQLLFDVPRPAVRIKVTRLVVTVLFIFVTFLF